MAGGTWTTQNKVRPGAYINFKGSSSISATVGERGVATLPLELPWGQEQAVIEINSSDNLKDKIGIAITDESTLLIREVFKRAKTLLLYRVNKGTVATATLGELIINAKYSGVKGNEITIVIQNNIDDSSKFEVITLFEGLEVDKQIVATIEELQENQYVSFQKVAIEEGEAAGLQTTAGLPLVGGDNGTVNNEDYVNYMAEIEKYKFNTIGLCVEDNTLKSLAVNFVKRLREDEGNKVQLVIADYKQADYEGALSVKNGVILDDNTIIDKVKAVAYVTGATAGASVSESLTYSKYDGAVDVDTRYTNNEIIQTLKDGEIVFVLNDGDVIIEQDINTLRTYGKDKNYNFSKNRVIRVLDNYGNDIKNLWDKSYIGKQDNTADGRNLFKKDIIKLNEEYQGMSAIENFVADDIVVIAGNDKDSVIVNSSIKPVDAMEKLYMNVEVR